MDNALSQPAVGDVSMERPALDMLAAAATHALHASGSCIVLSTPADGLRVVASHGAPAFEVHDEASIRALLTTPILIVEDTTTCDWRERVDPRVRSFASASFVLGSGLLGYLCIVRLDARSISGAQHYVLSMLAREAAACIERSVVRAVDVTHGRSDREKERLRLLESVVVHAKDAVLITEAEPIDAPGPRILYVNPAFTRTTGFDESDAIGRTPRILQGPGTDREATRKIRDALAAWAPIEIELVNYKKDGTPFWVELSIVPVADDGGFFTHWVSVQRDVTERKHAEAAVIEARVRAAEHAALAYRASHDELTALPNRPSFMESVTNALRYRAVDTASLSAALFIDLDRFKIVNDSLGHRTGDLFLAELSRRLQGLTRPTDILARLGGDEFGCLLTDLDDREQAFSIARRILDALRETVTIAGHRLSASASIGIRFLDDVHESAADVIRDADLAMYRAKRDGGARFALYDETLHASTFSRLQAEMGLYGALERDEFVLYYQPIVDLTTGRACALEALVRWNHPERGVILPSEFIASAEELGGITQLGTWVLQNACAQAAAWNRDPARDPVTVCVNVSSRQLDEHEFFAKLVDALATSGLDPHLLELELTESVLVEHQDHVGALIADIRSLGVRVALDDFGTGYSSLSYLERFPIDTLKIDRSFIERLSTSRTAPEIVRLIVAIAQALRIEVTAEGVETADQLQAALQAGCCRVQGFLFAQALCVDDATAYLVGPHPAAALREECAS